MRPVPFAVLLTACGSVSAQPQIVRPGIEVLLEDSLHVVTDASVGILTNQSGIDNRGVSDIDRLLAAGVQLNAIFSPEHGFRGVLDEEGIGHSVDPATGLPIYSMYGDTREPTAAMLDGIDVLLVDLQDIGARPYTYISTAILAMRAAGRNGVRFVVLDRPNPIGGQAQGPVLEDSLRGWGQYMDIPLRHGMTMGEMALYARATLGIEVDLSVVPVAGWTRDMWFDATGLPWVKPSPNMPDLESATHYPGLVAFERTNLSVGRGTPMAFQLIGAPWLDVEQTLDRIGEIPGLSLRDTVFTPLDPTDHKYDGVALRGLVLSVTDRGLYDPVRFGLAMFSAVQDTPEFEVRPPGFDRRMGRADIRVRLMSGETGFDVWETLAEDLATFERRVAPFILYR